MRSDANAVKNRILFDYFVNYVFPQYALPWNNFYTNIDAEPFYVRNEQRNQNARIFRTPLVVASKPEIFIVNAALPDWKATTYLDSEGVVVDSSATKSFVGKLLSDAYAGPEFQYDFSGKFAGVSCLSGNWVILHLNLANTLQSNKQSVVVVRKHEDERIKKIYSTLNGFITIDDNTIVIQNPIPYINEGNALEVLQACNGNTLYGIYGNRLFLAIHTNTSCDFSGNVTYAISARIVETVAAPLELTGLTLAAGI